MNYKKWLKLEKQKNIYNFTDKTKCIDTQIGYMLARTQSMFEYHNLPYTIPARILELYLQTNGNVCITEITQEDIDRSGKKNVVPGLYVFTGGMGGELDQYYMPTIYTVANPYLNYSRNLKIDVDCVVIPSDSLYIGLLPMYEKYSTALTENELSMNLAIINTRIVALLSAGDDSTQKAAEKYLKDITDGKNGVIGENAFLEGIKAQPFGSSANTNTLQNLIETEQYLRATWFNDLGLNSNYNMKRESINSKESQLNDDALLPLIDDMLQQRQIGLDKVNAMYGTDITVEKASSWEDNQLEIDELHESEDGEGGMNNEPENDD